MPTWPQAAPFVLLLFSNLFMTFAWYGHLEVPRRAHLGGDPGQLGDRVL